MDAASLARYDRIRPIRWTGEALELLDQRKLPFAVEYMLCAESDEVDSAIRDLDVRGADSLSVGSVGSGDISHRDVRGTLDLPRKR